MAKVTDTPATPGSRRRKVHTKSRAGCYNCKLRRVKERRQDLLVQCDERKPTCQRCITYGVTCMYTNVEVSGGDLLLEGEGSFQVQAQQPVIPRESLTLPDGDLLNLQNLTLELHDSEEIHNIAVQDIQALQRFQDRTVFTIGTAGTAHIYQGQIMRLLAEHGFLAHIVLGMTLMHDRIIENLLLPSQRESFHIYHGTGIFKRKLSTPIADDERDALWAGAALLGCITFASIYETDAEKCWPLRPPSQSDMDWINMGEGKKTAWELTNPLREGSIWRAGLEFEHNREDHLPQVARVANMEALYPFIKKISNQDDSSANAANDPYHTAASILGRLLPLQVTHSTIMYFLSYMGHMDPRYRSLLQAKDPTALLLLAWWLAKLVDYPVWWITRRVNLECRAICIYLERYRCVSRDILDMLDYPKMRCGLI